MTYEENKLFNKNINENKKNQIIIDFIKFLNPNKKKTNKIKLIFAESISFLLKIKEERTE